MQNGVRKNVIVHGVNNKKLHNLSRDMFEGAFITFVLAVMLYIFFYEAFRRPNSGGRSAMSK